MALTETVRENLLALADAYAKATGLSMSTISYNFYGQQAFFEGFRSGAVSVRLDKVESMIAKFSRDWPKGTPWPALKPVRMRRPTSKEIENILRKTSGG